MKDQEKRKLKLSLCKAEQNEIRIKIEAGEYTEAEIYYKDSNGLAAGKEELRRRGFCWQEEGRS